ncbi:ferritin-like domain-containing protein [Xylariales sp. AK1849]|nr:ferritin-like domain-containing protein [Xylariales sp. AK1849]
MRQCSLLLALASVAPSCLAAPLEKKADYNPLPGGDTDILNYALTLEYLERKFYQEGLANYTAEQFCDAGFNSVVYATLKTIAYDETQHVAFLSGALGSKAVHEATYSFPSTDPSSFMALASVLEGVGVSAYLGAAAVIADKTYIPIAGSILTVEARHSSFIRAAIRESPAPKPYDTPLDFNSVFSLAAQFITGFAPGDPALPFKAFPPINVVPSMSPYVIAGQSSVTFKGAAAAAKKAGLVDATQVYAVFFSGLDTYYAKVTEDGNDYKLATIPGANFAMPGQLPPSGQTYVVLSTADGTTKVSDENTISGVGLLEIAA